MCGRVDTNAVEVSKRTQTPLIQLCDSNDDADRLGLAGFGPGLAVKAVWAVAMKSEPAGRFPGVACNRRNTGRTL